MADDAVEADRLGHRLLQLSREWAMQGDDVFEVVGTGQVISPGSFDESIIYEELVEGGGTSQIFLSWMHIFMATVAVVSVWFTFSTRSFPSIWRTIIATLSRNRNSNSKRSTVYSGNSTMTPSSPETFKTTNRVVVNQRRETLTQDALATYASTPEVPTRSSSSAPQIVMIPEVESALTTYASTPEVPARSSSSATQIAMIPEVESALTTYASTPEVPTRSSSSATQAVMMPEVESTVTFCSSEQSHEITVQAAREVVTAANLLDQVLEESGRPRDPSAALNWAIDLHKTSRKLQAMQQEEQRRYTYDNWQRETDRAISERQHEKTISTMKAESAWAEKLVNVRDGCFESVSTAIVRGIILVAVSRLAPYLFFNPNILSFATLSNLVKGAFETMCSCHEDDDSSGDASSSVYAAYKTHSWSYIFFSEQLSLGFSFCHLSCVAKGLSGVIFFLVYSIVVKLVGLPSFVTTVITSTIGAVVLSRSAVAAITDLGRLIATQTVMSLLASAYFTTKWWLARRDLLKDDIQSNASLNEVLLAFDDGRAMVRLSPAILVIVAVLGELTFV